MTHKVKPTRTYSYNSGDGVQAKMTTILRSFGIQSVRREVIVVTIKTYEDTVHYR